MTKSWIRLIIIAAAVIVILAIAYSVYYLIVSDLRISSISWTLPDSAVSYFNLA